MQRRTLKTFLATLALAAFAPLAAAQFQAGMSVEQIEAQVKSQLATGATLAQIAQQALAAGLDAGLVTAALVTSSGNPADAVSAMLSAGAPVQVVVDAALGAGASTDSVTQGAVAAGVPPTTVQAAILASAGSGSIGSPSGTYSTPTGAAGAGGGGTGSTASPS
jgi:hypothetical protein